MLPRGLRPLATEETCRISQVGTFPLTTLPNVPSSPPKDL